MITELKLKSIVKRKHVIQTHTRAILLRSTDVFTGKTLMTFHKCKASSKQDEKTQYTEWKQKTNSSYLYMDRETSPFYSVPTLGVSISTQCFPSARTSKSVLNIVASVFKSRLPSPSILSSRTQHNTMATIYRFHEGRTFLSNPFCLRHLPSPSPQNVSRTDGPLVCEAEKHFRSVDGRRSVG